MTDRGDGVGLDGERGRVLRVARLQWQKCRGIGMGVAVGGVRRPYWLGWRWGGEVRVQGRPTAILVRTDGEFSYPRGSS